MNTEKDLVLPLNDALRARFPSLNLTVFSPMQHIGAVQWRVEGSPYVAMTPQTMDWRANDFRWWLHKFTDLISRKTGL